MHYLLYTFYLKIPDLIAATKLLGGERGLEPLPSPPATQWRRPCQCFLCTWVIVSILRQLTVLILQRLKLHRMGSGLELWVWTRFRQIFHFINVLNYSPAAHFSRISIEWRHQNFKISFFKQQKQPTENVLKERCSENMHANLQENTRSVISCNFIEIMGVLL